jgi:AcrR family transcriptional regulator
VAGGGGGSAETPGPGGPFAQARLGPAHPIVERLRARRSEIDEAIFARISDQWFDRTGSEDPEYVAGLRAAGGAALDYVLEGIERSGASLEPVPAAALEQARRAAHVGVGLDTVLRRYLAGYAVLEGFVVQEAERDEKDWSPRIESRPPKSALRDVLQRMSALVDRLITAVSRAYGNELEQGGVEQGDDAALASAKRPASARRKSRHDPTSRRDPPSRRDRILAAMAEVAAERGFEHASVKLVSARAGVSTRTFYEEFEGLQDCFLVVLDLALARAGELIMQAFVREQRWQDGLLGAIASLLMFLESEPLLARVWFVEAMAAGSWALQRREQIAQALTSIVLEYWAAQGEERPEPLAMAGVMAAVLGLVQTHLVTDKPEPLIELLGPLMGIVTSLRLEKQEVAGEVQRAAQVAREIQAGGSRWLLPAPAAEQDTEPGSAPDVTLFANLGDATARRLRECVLYLAEQDGRGGPDSGPSNREVGIGIHVVHQSQVSKLLTYLAQEGLVSRRSEGKGKRNAWRLTPKGEEMARVLMRQTEG